MLFRSQAQIEHANPIIEQTLNNQRQTKMLMPRLTTLENAQETTERWSRVLEHVSTQTPPQVWLTGVRCQAPDPTKPILVSFQGLSLSQEPVGELILRLQNCADLDRLTLKYTQEKLIEQSKATEFMVEADLVGTARQVTQEEDAK